MSSSIFPSSSSTLLMNIYYLLMNWWKVQWNVLFIAIRISKSYSFSYSSILFLLPSTKATWSMDFCTSSNFSSASFSITELRIHCNECSICLQFTWYWKQKYWFYPKDSHRDIQYIELWNTTTGNPFLHLI